MRDHTFIKEDGFLGLFCAFSSREGEAGHSESYDLDLGKTDFSCDLLLVSFTEKQRLRCFSSFFLEEFVDALVAEGKKASSGWTFSSKADVPPVSKYLLSSRVLLLSGISFKFMEGKEERLNCDEGGAEDIAMQSKSCRDVLHGGFPGPSRLARGSLH